MKHAGTMISMALSLVAAVHAAPAAAQVSPAEIRVGIVDVRADRLTFGDKATRIEYREFNDEGKTPASWQTESGVDHGQIVASAFVRQMRAIDRTVPIRMYSANAFQENSGTTGSALYHRQDSRRTLSVSWKGASRALDWFGENGVKVVVTAFNSNDNVALRAFMAKAQTLGITVFAGSSNKVGMAAYPAAYPQAISVAGDNPDLSFRKDASISTWVDFVMDGKVPTNQGGGGTDEGSSFAVAKAAAFGAYHVARNPGADRDAVEAAVRAVATSRTYSVQGRDVTVSHLDDRAAAAAMSASASQAFASTSKGPASSREGAVVVAALDRSQTR